MLKQFLKSVNICQSYRQVAGLSQCSMRLAIALLKDEEFAIKFTYNMKKVLLTVVTLVSPVILISVTVCANTNLMYTSFD